MAGSSRSEAIVDTVEQIRNAAELSLASLHAFQGSFLLGVLLGQVMKAGRA